MLSGGSYTFDTPHSTAPQSSLAVPFSTHIEAQKDAADLSRAWTMTRHAMLPPLPRLRHPEGKLRRRPPAGLGLRNGGDGRYTPAVGVCPFEKPQLHRLPLDESTAAESMPSSSKRQVLPAATFLPETRDGPALPFTPLTGAWRREHPQASAAHCRRFEDAFSSAVVPSAGAVAGQRTSPPG